MVIEYPQALLSQTPYRHQYSIRVLLAAGKQRENPTVTSATLFESVMSKTPSKLSSDCSILCTVLELVLYTFAASLVRVFKWRLTMVIAQFSILLDDNPEGVFFAGQTVTGRLHISISDKTETYNRKSYYQFVAISYFTSF